MNFRALQQFEHEIIQDFQVRLNSASIDCEFTCPNCHYDLSEIHIKDQFICGLFNDTWQTDILAKANQFKHLQDITVHAKAFETALSDQSKFHSSEIHAFCTKGPVPPKSNTVSSFSSTSTDSCNNSSLPRKANIQKKCSGCGSTARSYPGSNDRTTKSPAKGKTCHNCQKLNHFANVC